MKNEDKVFKREEAMKKVVNKGILIVLFALSICYCSTCKTVLANQSTQFDLYITEEATATPTAEPTKTPTVTPTEKPTVTPTDTSSKKSNDNISKSITITDEKNINMKSAAAVNTGNETALVIYFVIAMLSCTAAASILIFSKKIYRK